MRALEKSLQSDFGLPLVSIRLRDDGEWNDCIKARIISELQKLVGYDAREVRIDLFNLKSKYVLLATGFVISLQQRLQFAKLHLSIRIRPEYVYLFQVTKLDQVVKVDE